MVWIFFILSWKNIFSLSKHQMRIVHIPEEFPLHSAWTRSAAGGSKQLMITRRQMSIQRSKKTNQFLWKVVVFEKSEQNETIDHLHEILWEEVAWAPRWSLRHLRAMVRATCSLIEPTVSLFFFRMEDIERNSFPLYSVKPWEQMWIGQTVEVASIKELPSDDHKGLG